MRTKQSDNLPRCAVRLVELVVRIPKVYILGARISHVQDHRLPSRLHESKNPIQEIYLELALIQGGRIAKVQADFTKCSNVLLVLIDDVEQLLQSSVAGFKGEISSLIAIHAAREKHVFPT